MTSEASSPSAGPPLHQPGAIVVSETDSSDLRRDNDRRILLRLWHGLRAGGTTRRRH